MQMIYTSIEVLQHFIHLEQRNSIQKIMCVPVYVSTPYVTQGDLLLKKKQPPKEIMTHSFLGKSIVCYKGIQLCNIKKAKAARRLSVGVWFLRHFGLWYFLCEQRMRTKEYETNEVK